MIFFLLRVEKSGEKWNVSTWVTRDISLTKRSISMNWSVRHRARIYRPSFREYKPKTLVCYDWKRAFWPCFRDNWGYKFGHRNRAYFCKNIFYFIYFYCECHGTASGKISTRNHRTLRPKVFLEYFNQHCFICRLSDSTLSEDCWDAGIEPGLLQRLHWQISSWGHRICSRRSLLAQLYWFKRS